MTPDTAPAIPAEILAILHEVEDPEVPVVDVVDLGIVRGATVEGERVTVEITPTYSGCPAMRVIETGIEEALRRHGWTEVTIRTVFNPPWTTDWMSDQAREKLRRYGIAPPGPAGPGPPQLVTLGGPTRPIPCPYCGSRDTRLESEFGSTACKAIHTCLSCHQPFEHFKSI